MTGIRLLSIVGLGRSGSTLLERLLGQVEGVFPVGELTYLWERGVLRDELCGCGEPFSSCPFWSDVGSAAYGGWDHALARTVIEQREQVQRRRYVPMLARPRRYPRFQQRLTEYVSLIEPLYIAIKEVSQAELIVDSSKLLSYSTLLASVPCLDVTRLHLVRDSRSVAHAWTRSVVRPETGDRRELMPTFSTRRTALEWLVDNWSYELLQDGDGLFIRYEDLATDPARVVGSILQHLNTAAQLDLDGNRAWLRASHTISGNPMRFQSGQIEIRLDDRWRTEMRRRDQALVTTLTYPLLRRYRYRR